MTATGMLLGMLLGSLRPEFRAASSGHDPEFLASCRHAQETGLKPKTVYRQGVGGVFLRVSCASVHVGPPLGP